MNEPITIEDALADQVPGPVTSYIVVAAYIDEYGETILYADSPNNQPIHSSMGLLEFGKIYLHNKVSRIIDDII
jgi:hypothetical protein